ncbi:hypothetical protein JXB02_06200 [Candidatus Woesearchaeota archaeon]|nr:hypothetical protein [Candidatus Woesearchaeota archaeon]
MAAEQKGAGGPSENAPKDEQVGYHKGCLTTLAKERQELLKIVSIVEQLMQMHIGGLKDLGVDLEKQAKELMEKNQVRPKGTEKKIDELL